jgi:hypothetical protein
MSSYSRRLGPFLGELLDGGTVIDKWNVPEWSEKYDYVIQNGMVQRNAETGLYEATPGFESMVMPVLAGLNESAGMTAQQWQGITRGNPYKQFYDVLLEPMRQAWQEDVQSFVAEFLAGLNAIERVSGERFCFADCSIMNCIYAGAFLVFNRNIDNGLDPADRPHLHQLR